MKLNRAIAFRAAARVVAIALGFAGWASAHAASPSSESQRASDAAVTTLIGDAACDDDSQCRTIAMGAKACGGPAYYLAWSTKRTDEVALRQAAQGELSPPRVDRGLRSDCMFVGDPGAHCARVGGQPGVCRLRGASRGAPGRVD